MNQNKLKIMYTEIRRRLKGLHDANERELAKIKPWQFWKWGKREDLRTEQFLLKTLLEEEGMIPVTLIPNYLLRKIGF